MRNDRIDIDSIFFQPSFFIGNNSTLFAMRYMSLEKKEIAETDSCDIFINNIENSYYLYKKSVNHFYKLKKKILLSLQLH